MASLAFGASLDVVALDACEVEEVEVAVAGSGASGFLAGVAEVFGARASFLGVAASVCVAVVVVCVVG